MKVIEEHNKPTLDALRGKKSQLWLNPGYEQGPSSSRFSLADIEDAEKRMLRFAPLLARLFHELEESEGLIESPLLAVKQFCAERYLSSLKPEQLWIKADHLLPVAGSVKARGGIYEVLCLAEKLALDAGLITEACDYRLLMEKNAGNLFKQYQVTVGSTGNLGLSIGTIAAKLGFSASVHMSRDAKEWKKQRLINAGVNVVEHTGDYSLAVAEGREESKNDSQCYFVDDENSAQLFMGYAVAALRLKRQLQQAAITPSEFRPLFVYIPCGVGGAPGGICYGLKKIFGKYVHCFFAEPLQAPCMLYALAANRTAPVSELGLDAVTEADGLAVAQASDLVAREIKPLLSGIFTVADDDLFRDLYRLHCSEGVNVEPSAAASCAGPDWLLNSTVGRRYLKQQGLMESDSGAIKNAVHLLWTTGGLFVPAAEQKHFLDRGCDLQRSALNDQH
ncbi:D-serine ammonia-lyase [Motiliproteus sp. MSK22-1]|uniref:D-serine ammonia-lyase n=1 Tax=Motiliproteus sp. MSK22-1 TaxID=1897630 RepID=UPI000976B97B|nr:D-serine ammonia-lyase [Motiliproteus sp. MSK22-1]OMH32761.1 D-serine ammonia-lyase [Motiliproteus sp. MSK22-1]